MRINAKIRRPALAVAMLTALAGCGQSGIPATTLTSPSRDPTDADDAAQKSVADYFERQGASAYMLIHLLVDILNAIIDPRTITA